MKKSCLFHSACWSKEEFEKSLENIEIPGIDFELVNDSKDCDECRKEEMEYNERIKRLNEEFERNKIEFIQNISSIPRPKEWKQKLINRLLPPN